MHLRTLNQIFIYIIYIYIIYINVLFMFLSGANFLYIAQKKTDTDVN